MARGRQQKWICMDCKSEFRVQGQTPKFCCACGSENIGRAPSFELVAHSRSREKPSMTCVRRLNPVYARYTELKSRYDTIMGYWRQQRRRGYISAEELRDLAEKFDGAKLTAPDSSDYSGS